MLSVPYIKQKTIYSCGPASLSMMFLFHDVRISEKELSKRLKTNPKNGTLHSDLIRVAQEEGFYVYENDDSSIVEIGGLLKLGIPVIVHFVEPTDEDNHYSVVVRADDAHIILNDPWNGEQAIMEVDNFIERWSSERRSEDNWLMAISHEPFSLGRQYSPNPSGVFSKLLQP